jgi:hypothetical protein
MYTLLLSVFVAARMFTESLPSNDDILYCYKNGPYVTLLRREIWFAITRNYVLNVIFLCSQITGH